MSQSKKRSNSKRNSKHKHNSKHGNNSNPNNNSKPKSHSKQKHKHHSKRKKSSDPHRAREKAKYGQPIASREFILSLLREEKAPIQYKELADKLGISHDPIAMEALSRRVGAMQRDGQLIENRKRGLVPVDAEALLAGRISAHPDGFGFLVPEKDDGKGDIYLSAKQMRLVLHGDRSIVCITGVDRRGRREGRIVDVVDRANHTIVGRLQEEKGVIVISPDNKRIHLDLLIPPDQQGDAVHGDIVVAEIVEQPTRRHPPIGKVIEVLGKHMEPGMEIDMSLRSHDIPFEWPDAVTEQADGFSTDVSPVDKMGRKDVTRLPLVTIDGADARDFDDAVYCEKTNNGWRLLVAIADVAHYVQPDSPLDLEAVARGTSVYFPGRVVPMLPEVLSNGLCSINPQVERLCMLCEMTLDDTGSVKRARFYNAVMLSHARLTYAQVNEILTDESSQLHQEFSEVVPHLKSLHALYVVLAANRAKRGAIEFASTETRILFDENKKISEIVPVVRNDAHKLIEECMILANVSAAGFLEQHSIPALFRVHHGPKSDRLEDLRSFLSLRGLSLGGGERPTALDYATLSQQIEGRPDQSVVSTVMLRSMQQAVYQPKNEGHFGLALSQYAHFTSPIRRYPDLLVHRAIKHILKRESVISYRFSREEMNALGESCSTTERRAEEATRDVVSWLKCEYMQERVGDEFDGVITAVTSFGLFIELTDIHVEGLLHVTNLSRDYYRFEQAAQAMVGERTGKQYRLGDSITVRVDDVNLEDRKIDFSEAGVGAGKGANKRSGKKSDKKSRKAEVEADVAMPKPKKDKKDKKDKAKKQDKAKRKQSKTEKKTTAKKAALKQTSAEKAATSSKRVTKKASASTKKSATKKSAAKKSVTKKVNSKTSTAKKSSKKTSAKKTAAKKATAKKTATKKTASKKTASKKTASKKAAAKKTATKKTAAKRGVNKKAVAKKASAKKVARKKTQ